MRTNKTVSLSRMGVVLIEPEFGTNLGYVARTMANFGLQRLIVVSPKKLEREKLNEASVYASHGKKLINLIEIVPSMKELRKRFSLVIGTTAIEGTRKANLTRKTLGVEECASRLSDRIARNPSSSCIVFGRDTTGLTNDELRCCDYTMTIRVSESYNTLNISHAAAIIFFVFSKILSGSVRQRSNLTASTRNERERAVLLFEKLAKEAEFQKFKSGLLKEAMTRLFDRADPSLREIYLLMGLASKSTSKIRRLSTARS